MHIRTQSGKKIDLLNPKADDISIDDIAHGLAKACRYAGQIKEFYSVARHSILVSRFISYPWKLHGLLHDASESYLGDIVKHLKEFLPDYRAIECKVQGSIYARFGLSWPIEEELKHWDREVLKAEYHYLYGEAAYREEFPGEEFNEEIKSDVIRASDQFGEDWRYDFDDFKYTFNQLTCK